MGIFHRITAAAAAAGALTAVGLGLPAAAQAQQHDSGGAYINMFHHLRTVGSTVPGNGDVNPYGIVVLQHSVGRLHANDVLISNFNDKANQQGTGHTIVELSPGGHRTVFADISESHLPSKCPGGIGLSTALVVLPGGWVIVGSTPSRNGSVSTSGAGCLIVLNSQGQVKQVWSGNGIDGPWDSTAVANGSSATLFVANTLNGTRAGHSRKVFDGTVLRFDLVLYGSHVAPVVSSTTTIASGFPEQGNASAFVLGPTGIGLSGSTLYVAETDTSRIKAISDALTRTSSDDVGTLLTSHSDLINPLGLAIAPNGDVLTVNGGNGLIVETTPAGQQIATKLLDSSGSPKGAGALFGLAVWPGHGVYYVDDDLNALRLLH
jgi:hypothetical protein